MAICLKNEGGGKDWLGLMKKWHLTTIGKSLLPGCQHFLTVTLEVTVLQLYSVLPEQKKEQQIVSL